MKELHIYTDGGCKPNPGIGGWAAILISDSDEKIISGSSKESTNNIMEMTAIVNALKILKTKTYKIIVYSDSQYCVQGINTWRHGWKKRNWSKSSGELLNKELWIELSNLCDEYNVKAIWVRGHSNNINNQRVDALCTEEINKFTISS